MSTKAAGQQSKQAERGNNGKSRNETHATSISENDVPAFTESTDAEPDPQPRQNTRPLRMTRNPAPKYVDAVGFFGYVAR